jgi:hypothetical protein
MASTSKRTRSTGTITIVEQELPALQIVNDDTPTVWASIPIADGKNIKINLEWGASSTSSANAAADDKMIIAGRPTGGDVTLYGETDPDLNT